MVGVAPEAGGSLLRRRPRTSRAWVSIYGYSRPERRRGGRRRHSRRPRWQAMRPRRRPPGGRLRLRATKPVPSYLRRRAEGLRLPLFARGNGQHRLSPVRDQGLRPNDRLSERILDIAHERPTLDGTYLSEATGALPLDSAMSQGIHIPAEPTRSREGRGSLRAHPSAKQKRMPNPAARRLREPRLDPCSPESGPRARDGPHRPPRCQSPFPPRCPSRAETRAGARRRGRRRR